MSLANFAKLYRVDDPEGFRLKDWDPGDTNNLDIQKGEAKDLLEEGVKRLSDLQERLYPQDRWSVLLIFQAMDAAGKDSVIKHVMRGVNPQGCEVHSFKQPSQEELDHDFMWRSARFLPERGRIGIFNRSYYEEVLVVRVHPEILAKEKVPAKLVTKNIWNERFNDIRAFERYLARNGTVILKFFLHVSKEEQKRRFLERIEEPSKNWKFSMGDIAERNLWDKYMAAYEDMIRHTSRPEAPWHVVPADNKWFTRLVVAAEVVEALDRLGLKYPKLTGAARRDLEKAQQILRKER
jgi:PPK2 family polyphosphate:nucleotide phosphotransferase